MPPRGPLSTWPSGNSSAPSAGAGIVSIVALIFRLVKVGEICGATGCQSRQRDLRGPELPEMLNSWIEHYNRFRLPKTEELVWALDWASRPKALVQDLTGRAGGLRARLTTNAPAVPQGCDIQLRVQVMQVKTERGQVGAWTKPVPRSSCPSF
jgi:hypothetical protein